MDKKFSEQIQEIADEFMRKKEELRAQKLKVMQLESDLARYQIEFKAVLNDLAGK